MRPNRLYVDTNIFIRLFEGSDALSAALGRVFLLERRSDAKPFLTTSELAFAELFVDPWRESSENKIALYDSWTISNDYIEVGPVDRSVLWSAAILRARHRSRRLPDAIHVATALRFSGCTHFLTADESISGTYELSDSFRGQTFGPASVEVVRPEVAFLQSLVEAEP